MSSNKVRIVVAGKPVAKGRPRIGRMGDGRPTAFTPAKTRKYENLIRMFAAKAMEGREPFDESLAMLVAAVLPVPKSWSKKKRAQALNGEIRPVTRPDVDNYAKAAMDACNEIVFRDDSLIVALTATKIYGTDPKLVIEVSPR